MLPISELNQIREDLETTLPDICNITAMTRTNDGQGGWIEVWEIVTLAVPCRLDFIGGGEMVQSGALMPYTRAILTLPQNTIITEQNRVEHGGNTYTVQGVNLGSWLGVKRATLQISDYGGILPTPTSAFILDESGDILEFE